MNKDAEAVQNMVTIAFHLGKKNPKKWTKTDKRSHKLVENMITEFQRKLIGYECLKMAVVLSKDKRRISKNAAKFVKEEGKKIEAERNAREKQEAAVNEKD